MTLPHLCLSPSPHATSRVFAYTIHAGGAKFASCFVCKQQGHLSAQCPKNSRGVYPRGGGCKVCGSVRHFARDCPDEADDDGDAGSASQPGDGSGSGAGAGASAAAVKDGAGASGGDDLDDGFGAIEPVFEDVGAPDKVKKKKSKKVKKKKRSVSEGDDVPTKPVAPSKSAKRAKSKEVKF